ncbi:Lrp/AsnC family transcriptional regulator [Afifella pfennigii]|uniref:Lrp/AsnC family transcriptional regulator n=1 Tax=Afifella pfennigii TaxID=209897 RepID=UPI0004799B1E|nr:AsnC family transcriptional regulator [Afifella pfennigii]
MIAWPLPPDTLDETDRRILDALQEGFPLTSRPFAAAGAALGLAEGEMIERIAALREMGAITRFGPFFDAAAMGGDFCLCAMAVPAGRFQEVAALLNRRCEVEHACERSHALNMWFVLAVETADDIDRLATEIESESGLAILRFPELAAFFVGFGVRA